MKAEHEPVTDDEFVLRLIWCAYYNAGLPLAVQPAAFQPRDSEVEGISVFREACLPSPEDALRVIAPDKRSRYHVARLSVSDLAKLGLSVRPDLIDTAPGHAVIPELNAAAHAADRLASKALQKRLADLASQQIVRRTEG
jgi:hypothetical protein